MKMDILMSILEETGLVISNDNKKIDRFRGRIIFPIKEYLRKSAWIWGKDNRLK